MSTGRRSKTAHDHANISTAPRGRRGVLIQRLKGLWAQAGPAIAREESAAKLDAWRAFRDAILVEAWSLEQVLHTPGHADVLLASAAEGLEKLEAKLAELASAAPTRTP
jgi:hypothetical protein